MTGTIRCNACSVRMNERTGACPTCKITVEPQALKSPFGGFYIGTMCHCGPYTRESEYYQSKDQAQDALNHKTYYRV